MPAAPKSWMPLINSGGEQLQGALDQQLFHERVADLHRRAACDGFVSSKFCRRQYRRAADAVAAGRAHRTKITWIAGAGRAGPDADPSCRSTPTQSALTSGLPRYAAVEAPPRHRCWAGRGSCRSRAMPATTPGQHPARCPGSCSGPKRSESITRDRPGAHGEDVADDAADTGGRTLVRLDVARVIVRFDLEGDGITLADVDHPRVLADTGQELADRGVWRQARRTCASGPWTTWARVLRTTSPSTWRISEEVGRRWILEIFCVLVRLQPQLGHGCSWFWGVAGIVYRVRHSLLPAGVSSVAVTVVAGRRRQVMLRVTTAVTDFFRVLSVVQQGAQIY